MSRTFAAVKFTGGVNDWFHPGLLDAATAAELLNADISSGKLVPVKKPLLLTDHDPTHYGHYGTRDRSVVKWYDRFYWSDNIAASAPYYGGNVENYLGIPYPAYSGAGANVSISATSPESGESGMTGEYKYCVTFVNVNGWEGAPGSAEEYEVALTLNAQIAELTVTWTDDRISYAKIYRTIDHGADFYCVGETATSGAAFRDTVTDADAQMMNPLSTQDNFPPPDGGKFLCEYGGVFFLAVGDKLYFSGVGNPHAWPTLQFLAFDDIITGIAPEFQGVLVFTRNNAFRVTGADSAETVNKTYIPGNHGCVTFRSIAVLNNAPVWLSSGGLCLWDGSSVSVASYGKVKTDLLAVRYAAAAHDCFYLFHTRGTLVFDRRTGDTFRKLDFTCDYAWYDSDSDLLILQSGGRLYQFGAGSPLTMRYASPYIGGAESAQKIFLELFTVGDGIITATVAVDGKSVATVTLPAGRNRVKLPRNAVGRYLQTTLKSSGTITEMAVTYD